MRVKRFKPIQKNTQSIWGENRRSRAMRHSIGAEIWPDNKISCDLERNMLHQRKNDFAEPFIVWKRWNWARFWFSIEKFCFRFTRPTLQHFGLTVVCAVRALLLEGTRPPFDAPSARFRLCVNPRGPLKPARLGLCAD